MATTTDRAAGGRILLVEALKGVLADARKCLPKGLNGRGPAPSDPRAAQLRKDIAAGRSSLIDAIVTIVDCDIIDGVPSRAATEWLREIIDYADTRAMTAPIRSDDRPIMALLRAETKAQSRADLAQLRVAESPECETALVDAIRELEHHATAAWNAAGGCRTQLALVRVTESRRIYGARRNEEGRPAEAGTPSRFQSEGSPTSNARRKDSYVRPMGASRVQS